MVTLLATVRDRNGLIAVKNLNREDFVLEENGALQTIRYFSRESDLPLTIGLLVDTSQSQKHVLEPERRASYTFLDQVLRPDTDLAFVAHFDVHVEVLQSFTSSRNDLAAALTRLKVPSALSTLLYDAIRECSENLMKEEGGTQSVYPAVGRRRLSQQDDAYDSDRVCATRGYDRVFHSFHGTASAVPAHPVRYSGGGEPRPREESDAEVGRKPAGRFSK